MSNDNRGLRHSLDEVRARPELLGLHESCTVICRCCGRVDVITPTTADLRNNVRGIQWARYYPRRSAA